MTQNKVLYPGAGCVVEFMHDNTPTLAFVLEEHNGKLRLLTQNMRESTLNASRLLSWAGPIRGANLSRQAISALLEEHKNVRAELAKQIDIQEIWELAQNEVDKAPASWFASLRWETPTIDHEAAMGHALLQHKTHFRYTPPDFEVFNEERVALRLQELEANRMREAIAAAGTLFFHQLWDAYIKGQRGIGDSLEPELAEKLRHILFTRMASPESSEDETLWKLLCKGLPEHPHLALCLAVAWGLVPEHYNDLLDQANFTQGDQWVSTYATDEKALLAQYTSYINDPSNALENQDIFHTTPTFISMDPASANDRDDAFFLETDPTGNTVLHIALACPALCWSFGSALDKAVLRRATSLYLPEGDEHMLPPTIGWQIFSLAQGACRPCLLISITLDQQAVPLSHALHVGTIHVHANLSLEQGETALAHMEAEHPVDVLQEPARNTKSSDEPDWAELFQDESSKQEEHKQLPLDANHPATPYSLMLYQALVLAKKLQLQRVANGAVITERPDPIITTHTDDGKVTVSITENSPTFRANLVVGESMILANQLVAQWSIAQSVPLIYRTQDVGLPKEYAGIWSTPQDISRVIKALPSASLDTTPRRHAGLGLTAYTSCTSPIRRYVDLFNQGQITHFLQHKTPRFAQEEVASLHPLISARLDAVGQVQRLRPRYWKLLFFRQQGDKAWWPAVITEENNMFVSLSLPWAQLFLRGKRNLFGDKVSPGQTVSVRLGKINPLLNEIQILEVQEE